jgi:hypothetical protein
MLGEMQGPPEDAELVVIARSCQIAWPAGPFDHMADRGNYQLWTRRSGPLD